MGLILYQTGDATALFHFPKATLPGRELALCAQRDALIRTSYFHPSKRRKPMHANEIRLAAGRKDIAETRRGFLLLAANLGGPTAEVAGSPHELALAFDGVCEALAGDDGVVPSDDVCDFSRVPRGATYADIVRAWRESAQRGVLRREYEAYFRDGPGAWAKNW